MILRRKIRTAADRNAGRLVSQFRGGLFLRFFIRCRSAMAGGSSIGAGQSGTCGRNYLIASSQWNVDLSTLKDFRIAETHALQFGMEMFNAPNCPAWGAAQRAVGFGEYDAFHLLRTDPFHKPVAADRVCVEALLLRGRCGAA